ncbi:MAG: response regulator [Deltaproteobacteria bacterium]|nr:response regulator [Deltaproteobacteria bacterium]
MSDDLQPRLIETIREFQSRLPSKILDTETRANALIVDPDKESRKQLKAILEDMGYGVFYASSIEDAVANVESIKNLSVVVSVPRPDGTGDSTGISFLSEISVQNPSLIPVLSVTFAESEDAVDALRKNITGFFIKPYDTSEVKRSLSDLLYLHDKHDFLTRLIHDFFKKVDSIIP